MFKFDNSSANGKTAIFAALASINSVDDVHLLSASSVLKLSGSAYPPIGMEAGVRLYPNYS